MALSQDLTILLGDIGVAFMNTPMLEGEPVYVMVSRKGIERFEGRISTLS